MAHTAAPPVQNTKTGVQAAAAAAAGVLLRNRAGWAAHTSQGCTGAVHALTLAQATVQQCVWQVLEQAAVGVDPEAVLWALLAATVLFIEECWMGTLLLAGLRSLVKDQLPINGPDVVPGFYLNFAFFKEGCIVSVWGTAVLA